MRHASLLLLLVCLGCGPIGIGAGAAAILGDDPQDLGQPEVSIEVVTATGSSAVGPEFTNEVLLFAFKTSKPGVGLTALLVGPVPFGTDADALLVLEQAFCDTGAAPAAALPVDRTTGLTTDPAANAAFNAKIAALGDGRYVLYLLGVDGQGRRDCESYSWILDTTPPTPSGLASLEASEPRTLSVRWTLASDPAPNPDAQPSGLAGYRIHFDVGSRNIPDDPRPADPPLNGASRFSALEGGSGLSPVFVAGGGASEHDLVGLFAGRMHYVRVTAVDRAGNESDLASAAELGGRTRMGGDGTFRTATTVAVNAPGRIVTADFDRDGHLDAAVANVGTNRVTVLYGNGDLTFRAPVELDVGAGRAVADLLTGEYHLDNRPDLAVLTDQGFLIVPGGEAGLGTPESFTYGGAATSFAQARFDPSGLDIVVGADVARTWENVTVGGRALGGFEDITARDPPSLGPAPRCLHLHDFYGNGYPDLVFCDGAAIGIQKNNGFGRWDVTQQYAAGGTPHSFVVADCNGDGQQDLAVATTNGKVAVVLRSGSGPLGEPAFDAPASIDLGSAPGHVVAADFDGDAILDLATAGSIPGAVALLFGNGNDGVGDGTFRLGRSFPVGGTPTALHVADLDRDGIEDLMVSLEGGSVAVLAGDGAHAVGAAAYVPLLEAAGPSRSLAAADLDADGVADLVSARGDGVDVLLFAARHGQATGGLSSSTTQRPGTAEDIVVHDADGDGLLDITCQGAATLAPGEDPPLKQVLLPRLLALGANGRPSGTFKTERAALGVALQEPTVACDPPFPGGERALAVGDSFLACLAADEDLGGLRGIQTGSRAYFLECDADGVAAADVDGDRLDDLVAVNGTFGSASILRGDGSGSFSPFQAGDPPYVPGAPDGSQTFACGPRPARPLLADLNGDGVMDLVVLNRETDDLSVLFGRVLEEFGPGERPGQAAGEFEARTAFTFTDEPTRCAAADLDGDGVEDLVVLLGAARKVVLLLGAGSGLAVTQGFDVPGSGPAEGVAVADFTSDGIPDIAVGGDRVRVFVGRGTVVGD